MKIFNIKISSIFLIALIVGLLLRIIIMFWSFNFRENTDTLRWKDWGRISYLHNLSDTYKPTYLTFGTLPNNMPPGTLYTVAGMYNLNLQISKVALKLTGAKEGNLLWINQYLPNLLFRLPSIISDILIAFLIYYIVKEKKSDRTAIFSSSLFLFNPVVIYNSAFSGQMDALNNVFAFISIFLLYKNRLFPSILFVFLSLFIKLSLIFYIPVYLVLLLQKKSIKKIVIYTILSFACIILIILPLSRNPIGWLLDFMRNNSLGEMQNITAFAFNSWWMIMHPVMTLGDQTTLFSFSEIRLHNSPIDSTIYFGISLFKWAIAIFGIFLIPILMCIHKLKQNAFDMHHLLLFFALTAMIGFLFLPRMHERYLYPAFPLLAAYIGLQGRYLAPFIALSFLQFLNYYFVWHPFSTPLIPYSFIANPTAQWSISFLTVLTVIGIYISVLKQYGLFNWEKNKN